MVFKNCCQFGRATHITTILTIRAGDFSCIPVRRIIVTEALCTSIDISVLHWMCPNRPGSEITLAIKPVGMDHLYCGWTSGFIVSLSIAIMYAINAK
jgi:hypothetical protein